MKFEMDSTYPNLVWTFIDVPDGMTPIGCKWIFKGKIEVVVKVETYKAKLVAKEFKQKHGTDYDETFSLVSMLKSIQILLAIATYHDYKIWHMDVKTTFLIWMTYYSLGMTHQCCNLSRLSYPRNSP